MKLTEKEFKVLDAIIDNEYQDAIIDKNLTYDQLSSTWLEIVSDYSYQGKVFSGLISSLTDKGFVGTDITGLNHQDISESTIWITDSGFNAWKSLKTFL